MIMMINGSNHYTSVIYISKNILKIYFKFCNATNIYILLLKVHYSLLKVVYVSVVWWPMVGNVEPKNLLRSLQGIYVRAAVLSMKATPTQWLEVALCNSPGPGCHSSSQMHCTQIEV